MTKSRMDLTPGGSGVLDLVERTGVQRLVARRLVDLSGEPGEGEGQGPGFRGREKYGESWSLAFAMKTLGRPWLHLM